VSKKRSKATRKKFLREQKKISDWARNREAAVEFAIVWKRKAGVYEEGATGSRC